MSAEHEAALSYIRRVLGMQPSIAAQLTLREQQVEILTAEVDRLRAQVAAVEAAVAHVEARPGPDGEPKVHTVLVRAALASGGEPETAAFRFGTSPQPCDPASQGPSPVPTNGHR